MNQKVRFSNSEHLQASAILLRELEKAGKTGRSVQELTNCLATHFSQGWSESTLGVGKSARQRTVRILKGLLADRSNRVGVKVGEVDFPPGADPKSVNVGPGFRHLWYMEVGTNLPTSSQSGLIAAISLNYSAHFLPPSDRQYLQRVLESGRLRGAQTELYKRWLKNLKVAPRYPSLHVRLPDNYPEIEQLIFEALEAGRGFRGWYIGEAKPYIYRPVKLVRRECVNYIACTVSKDDSYKEYALHRFSGVELVDANLPPTPNEDEYVFIGGKVPWGAMESDFVFEISGKPAQHLSEIYFHEDSPEKTRVQVVERCGNGSVQKAIITVSDLQYSYEIYCWLLGLGEHIRVLGPPSVARHVRDAIEKMYQTTL